MIKLHRNYVVLGIVDVEERLLFFGFVGLDGNGHLLLVVKLDGGKLRGRRHDGRLVVSGKNGQGQS